MATRSAASAFFLVRPNILGIFYETHQEGLSGRLQVSSEATAAAGAVSVERHTTRATNHLDMQTLPTKQRI